MKINNDYIEKFHSEPEGYLKAYLETVKHIIPGFNDWYGFYYWGRNYGNKYTIYYSGNGRQLDETVTSYSVNGINVLAERVLEILSESYGKI